MKTLLKKLKERWKINSNRQLLLILVIFSISGMSVLYVRKAAFAWLGFTNQTPFWEEAVVWLLVVVPSYQLLFLIYGTLLGQFEFAWQFVKKNINRLKQLAKKVNLL
ncbi:DUF6787 family protein [Fodinibius sp. SL11]|uniref:DUF6787 family protein n=1 Tax=Fodinibius sp. SL11 TaxID=3425690 RepID=UPI003F883302